MKKYQFGVDYYPEHWPKERWTIDAQMMRDMGIQIVRLAEFSWQKFEPRAGEFHFEELDEAIRLAFTESEEVLIEECITGREMGCGVMIAGGKEYIFPITEIIAKNAFFDYEAKYTAGMSDEITPAPISEEWAKMLAHDALVAYKACRCRGIVRIDFIVTEEGKAYIIEVNSIPGMSSGSIVPKQVRAAGMTLGELFDIVIADSLKRFK